MINVTDVSPGDRVVLQDRAGNVAEGEALGGDGEMWVEAFGTRLVFAKFSRAGNWRPHPAIRVVGHTAPLFPGAA